MFAAEILKSLLRSERNQQLMCESGLPGDLLKCCRIALEEEAHPLHSPLQYILERLAAQNIEPKDLRYSTILYRSTSKIIFKFSNKFPIYIRHIVF